MARDNHASYTRIGLTVVIGVVAIVATLIYLGGMRGRGSEILVETYYDKPVAGLSVGSVVNFRGVKIGEVREISFVGNKYVVEGQDGSRIYILIALDGRTLAAADVDEKEFAARQREYAEFFARRIAELEDKAKAAEERRRESEKRLDRVAEALRG